MKVIADVMSGEGYALLQAARIDFAFIGGRDRRYLGAPWTVL